MKMLMPQISASRQEWLSHDFIYILIFDIFDPSLTWIQLKNNQSQLLQVVNLNCLYKNLEFSTMFCVHNEEFSFLLAEYPS